MRRIKIDRHGIQRYKPIKHIDPHTRDTMASQARNAYDANLRRLFVQTINNLRVAVTFRF